MCNKYQIHVILLSFVGLVMIMVNWGMTFMGGSWLKLEWARCLVIMPIVFLSVVCFYFVQVLGPCPISSLHLDVTLLARSRVSIGLAILASIKK